MEGSKKMSPLSPRRPQSVLGDTRSTRMSQKYGEIEEVAVFPGAFSPRKAIPYQRPHTAMYMSPRTEFKVDRQMTRTPDAKISSRIHKTEKYREEGFTRWPPLAQNLEISKPNEFKRMEDALPLNLHTPNQDSNCPAELWRRSLRRPGVDVSDGCYETVAGTVQMLSKEWAAAPRSQMGERSLAYTGRTTGTRLATPRKKNTKEWVMRPVSVGQFALDHHEGKRYAFSMTPKTLPVQVGICQTMGGTL